MSRGFKEVAKEHKTAYDVFKDEKNKEHKFPKEIKLPTRSDKGSAGYDFYVPKDVKLLPAQKTIIWTDVKAYMEENEALLIYIRSSLAVKQGVMLSNSVGVVDASYFENKSNDGNIGIAVVNTSGKAVYIKEGERIAQGIFTPYLVADEDSTVNDERTGGVGSSGK